MSLMNDALRKKAGELRQLTGGVGTFRKKAGSVRSRKWGRISGFSIAFLVVMALGSALSFFFFRAAPAPVMPLASPVAIPEPDVTVVQTTKDAGAASPEVLPPPAAPDVGNKIPESEIHFKKTPAEPDVPPVIHKVPVAPLNKKPRVETVAIETFPESLQPKKRGQTVVDPADRFYQKAVSYHRENRLAAAIELYLAVLKENPGHTAARFNLAAAHIQTGAFLEAFSLLETLRARDTENPDILLNMAISKIGLGDLHQALVLLNAAEEKQAPAFELCFHRGVIFSRSQLFEEALRWYQKAEEIHPQEDRLVYNLALTYDRLQQHEAALRNYLLFLDRAAACLPGEKEAVADRVRVLRSYLGRH